jgi:hypothetical protein
MKNYYLDRAKEKEEKKEEEGIPEWEKLLQPFDFGCSNDAVYIVGVDLGSDIKNVSWAYSGTISPSVIINSSYNSMQTYSYSSSCYPTFITIYQITK